jgi:hypothetical protein
VDLTIPINGFDPGMGCMVWGRTWGVSVGCIFHSEGALGAFIGAIHVSCDI